MNSSYEFKYLNVDVTKKLFVPLKKKRVKKTKKITDNSAGVVSGLWKLAAAPANPASLLLEGFAEVCFRRETCFE